MKITTRVAALSASVLAFASAQAGVVSQDCTGCSTAQIEALAVNCNQGYSYAHDFAGNRFYKLCFSWDVNDAFRPPKREKTYQWITPEIQYQNAFQAYENVYLNNGNSKNIEINVRIPITESASSTAGEMHTMLSPVTDNGYVNAYDTIVSASDNDRIVQTLMTNYFNSTELQSWNPPWGSALVAAIAQAENFFKSDLIDFSNFNATYTVHFNDGSQRTYQFSSSMHTFVAVPNSARDAHGQLIPENANAATNGYGTAVYNYENTPPGYDMPNLETLLRNMGAQGIPIVSGGGGGSVTCSWNGSTNTLTCTIKQF